MGVGEVGMIIVLDRRRMMLGMTEQGESVARDEGKNVEQGVEVAH